MPRVIFSKGKTCHFPAVASIMANYRRPGNTVMKYLTTVCEFLYNQHNCDDGFAQEQYRQNCRQHLSLVSNKVNTVAFGAIFTKGFTLQSSKPSEYRLDRVTNLSTAKDG